MQKITLFLFLVFSSFAHSAELIQNLKNESEAGLVITGGNSETQSISLKDQTSYTFDKNIIKFTGNFLKASNSGVESAYRYSLGLRYERELADKFSIYLGQIMESDKFQSIRQRYHTDVGGKYFFTKSDDFKWFAEAGYRFTRTNYFTYFQNQNYLRAYTELEGKFNSSVSGKYWIEYLPNITESADYQINTEASLSAMVSDIFSVKTAYLIRFDNVIAPGVKYKTDSTFTTSLVAKF